VGKGHLSVLTYKALHTGQPCYLADFLDLYRPSRALRSTNSHLLAVPSCSRSSFASRAFCVSSPNNWNSLPLNIRSSDSLSSPVLNLTFLLLPITSSHSHASASDSTFDYWRYIINFSLTLTLTLRSGNERESGEAEIALECANAYKWIDIAYSCMHDEILITQNTTGLV